MFLAPERRSADFGMQRQQQQRLHADRAGSSAATVVTASGDIAAKVDEYRLLLGDPKNGGDGCRDRQRPVVAK